MAEALAVPVAGLFNARLVLPQVWASEKEKTKEFNSRNKRAFFINVVWVYFVIFLCNWLLLFFILVRECFYNIPILVTD